jgi:hypothetical protein
MADNDITVTLKAIDESLSNTLNSTNDALGAFKDSTDAASNAVQNFDATNADEQVASLREALNSIKEVVVSVLEAFGAFEAYRFGKEIIQGALELGGNLSNLSIETGISTDHLQVLDLAAQASGKNLQQLTMITARLSLAATQFSPRISEALSVFGLHRSDLNDTYEALKKIGEEMSAGGPKANEMMNAFTVLFGGRFGRMFLPAIKSIDEFEQKLSEMGLMLTGTQINALKATDEAWNILGYAWQQDKALLTSQLTPALLALANILTTLLTSLGQTINSSTLLGEASQRMGQWMITTAEEISIAAIRAGEEIATEVEKLKGQFNDLSDAITGIIHPLDAVEAKGMVMGAALRGQVLSYHDALQQITEEGSLGGIKAGGVDLGKMDESKNQLADYLAQLQHTQEVEQNLLSKATTPSVKSGLGAALANTQAEITKTEGLLQKMRTAEESALSGPGSTGAQKAIAEVMRAADAATAGMKKLQVPVPGNAPAPTGSGELPIIESPQELAKDAMEASKIKEAALAIDQATAKQEAELGKTTGVQEVQSDIDTANKRYEAQKEGLDKSLAALKGGEGVKPGEIAEVNAQIAELESQHSAEMITLATKQYSEIAKLAETANADKVKTAKLAEDIDKAQVDAQIKTQTQMASLYGTSTIAAERAAIEERYAEEKQGLDNQLELAQQYFDNVKQVYGQLAPEYKAAADKITDIQNQLNVKLIAFNSDLEANTDKTTQDILSMWHDIASEISDELDKAVDDFLTTKGVKRIEAFKQLYTEMIQSTIKSAISGIVVGGAQNSISGAISNALTGQSGGLAGIVANAFQQSAIAKSLQNALAEAWNGVTSVIKSVLTAAWNGISGLLSKIFGGALSGTGSVATKAATSAVGATVPAPPTGVASAVSAITGGTTGGVCDGSCTSCVICGAGGGITGAAGLGGAATSPTAALGAVTGTATGGAPAAGGGIFGGLGNIFTSIRSALSQAFTSISSVIGNVFSSAFRGAQSIISSVFGTAFKGASSLLSSAGSAVGGAASAGGAGLATMGKTLITMASSLETMVAQGALSLAHDLELIAQGATQIAQDAAYYAEALIDYILMIVTEATSVHPFGFAGGGIVPAAAGGMVVGDDAGGTFSILHAREMVLPARLSEGVQNIINNGQTNPQNADVNRLGDTHLHVHAIDSRGVKQFFDEHGAHIARVLQGQARRDPKIPQGRNK